VREVGETRDARRFPCRSDLPDLVRQFRAFSADKQVFEPRNLNCKLIPHTALPPSERWDIDRFWSDAERLELGFSATNAVSVDQFESELSSIVEAVTEEIEQLKTEVPREPQYIEIALSDENFFKMIRGQRVTKKDVHNNPGPIPVISGHREAESYLGEISEDWLRQKNIPIYEKSLITVNANGSVGGVFLRTEPKYTVHDDVIAIDVTSPKIHPLYAVYAIRESVARARFRYDAKLYMKRLSPLKIRVPIDANGEIDVQQQQALAAQYERLEMLKRSIQKFATDLEDKFITTDFSIKELTLPILP
jgi:type I restriction enzyme M protein